MKTHVITRSVYIALAIFGFGFANGVAGGKVLKRPIEDFLETQGTACIDFGGTDCFLAITPVPPYATLWFDPTNSLLFTVDYAGLANEWAGGIFNTSFSGSVTEKEIGDGLIEVKVVLHTKNALTWVINDPDGELDVLDIAGTIDNVDFVFGARAPDVVFNGATPVLGSSLLKLTFVREGNLGDPLPDFLEQAILGRGFNSVSLHAFAKGDHPDGTPGWVRTDQVGLFGTSANEGSAVADGYPVEQIILK